MGREPARPDCCSTEHRGRTTTKCHPQPHKTPGATDMERYNPGETTEHDPWAGSPRTRPLFYRPPRSHPHPSAPCQSRLLFVLGPRHQTPLFHPPLTWHHYEMPPPTPNKTPGATDKERYNPGETTGHDQSVRSPRHQTPVLSATEVASASQRSLSVAPVVGTRPAPSDPLFHPRLTWRPPAGAQP